MDGGKSGKEEGDVREKRQKREERGEKNEKLNGCAETYQSMNCYTYSLPRKFFANYCI